MKKYKVIRCSHCGRISVSSAVKIFRCTYCKKSCKFFKKREIGTAVNLLESFNHPRAAAIYCQQAKDEIEGEGLLKEKRFYDSY